MTKAISTRSVWIYHVSSQSFPGLTLIAGFLTTERRRRFKQRKAVFLSADPSTDNAETPEARGEGSIAITAVFVNESYRGRGVAESLVRTATRYYLAGEEPAPAPSPSLSSTKLKRIGSTTGSSSSAASSVGNSTTESQSADGAVVPVLSAATKELFDFVSVYVDPKNESTCRVFSRVGYGIMDKEEREDIPIPRLREALGEQYRQEWELPLFTTRNSHLRGEGLEEEAEEEALNTPGVPMPGALPKGDALPTSSDASAAPDQQDTSTDSDHTPKGTALISTTAAEKPDPIDLRPIPVHSINQPVQDECAAGEGDQIVAIKTARAVASEVEDELEGEQQAQVEEEAGPPLPQCASVEDWEVVSLRNRNTEEGRRIRGVRRDGEKRLSIDGPWQ